MDASRHSVRLDAWRAWLALAAGLIATPSAVSGASGPAVLADPAVLLPILLGGVVAFLFLRPSGYALDDEALRMRVRGRSVVWPLDSIRRVDLAQWSDARECHVVFEGGAVRRVPPRILPDLKALAAELRARGVEVATL
ncbi:MAG: hypothetical protein ACU0BS_10525 [Hasllibacter sp.]